MKIRTIFIIIQKCLISSHENHEILSFSFCSAKLTKSETFLQNRKVTGWVGKVLVGLAGCYNTVGRVLVGVYIGWQGAGGGIQLYKWQGLGEAS